MCNQKIISFRSSTVTYALPVEVVGEMVPLGPLEPIPGVQPQVRGGLVIRAELIPVIDLRALLGHQTLLSERKALVELLNQREQDHIAWIDDLMKSVKTGEEFRKTTNPKKCAFGQWYYSYVPQDSVVERYFRQFEAPHDAIHALGTAVLEKAQQGLHDEAVEMITRAKNGTLRQLLNLFAEFKESLLRDLREIAIILTSEDGHKTALAVDSLQQILDLSSGDVAERSITGQDEVVKASLNLPQGVIYCLEPSKLFATALC